MGRRTPLTEEEIRNRCEKVGLTYVRHWIENKVTYVECLCKCGRTMVVILKSISQYAKKNKFYACKECGHTKTAEALKGRERTEETKQKIKDNHADFSGEKNPKYNYDLTNEDRISRRHIEGYKEWEQGVKHKANYTCDICSQHGGKLHSHHLDSYNWCKEKRTDINNGICLCCKCHREFHHIYGQGNNTKEQYKEFKQIKQNENTSKTA